MKKRLPQRFALLFATTFVAGFLSSMNGASAASASASIVTPTSLTSSETISFSSDVWQVSTKNVVLRLQNSTTDLAASILCTNASGQTVGCSLGPVRRVVLKPASWLIPGQRYSVVVNPSDEPSGPVSDYLLLAPVATISRDFIASLTEQETSAAASYQWRNFSATSAYGGSYQADYLASSLVSFGFTGTSLTWYTLLGPDQGLAYVIIDNVSHGTANNYYPTVKYRVGRTYSGLSSGYHRVTIQVRGLRGSTKGVGTWVGVDAFAFNGTPVQPSLRFGWQSVSATGASAGKYVRTGAHFAVARFVFRGRTIDWFTITGPSQGAARMYIDGVLKTNVNNYATTTHYGVVRRVTNLSDAVHRLDIVSVSGGMTSVDRFLVRLPDLTIFRGLGTWVDHYDYGTAGGLDASTALPAMHSRGIRTIYIETARYNSSSAFDYPTAIGAWVEAAHANGMKIVGWYLPAYGTYLNNDVSRTVAIATYRSPAGQSFDGLGIDIEYKTSAQARSAWFADIATHLARVRSGATAAFPVAAVIPAPLAMDISPASWSGFPWAAVGTNANIVMPMGYWTYRTDCATNSSHCAYGYSVGNINEARTKTGGLPVHLIGGVADKVTSQGVKDFIKATHDAKAYGASLYDYRTTSTSLWSILAGANTL
jgi:hypothetical protein